MQIIGADPSHQRFQDPIAQDQICQKGSSHSKSDFSFSRDAQQNDRQKNPDRTRITQHRQIGNDGVQPQGPQMLLYRIQNGKSYLNYLRNEMRFKCDWKKRLFSSSFTTTKIIGR